MVGKIALSASLVLVFPGCWEDKGGDSGIVGEVGPLVGITDAHNAIRAAHGVGDLEWDDGLAEIARGWSETLAADNCGFYHSGNGYGENLFTGAPAGFYSAEDVVNAWASEEAWYDYESNRCDPPSGGTCGHYTQVVWADTTKVGCGYVVCDNDWEIWTCTYDPPGNYVGEKPY